jgi:hypothetical protein
MPPSEYTQPATSKHPQRLQEDPSPPRRPGARPRVVLERLRALSPPLRYLAYVAGTLLVLLAAVGVGATAAVVVGERPEGVTSGSGSPVAKGAGEGALSTKMGEASTAFTHTATDANSRGDYTYISDPAIDGDPDAGVLVVPSADRDNAKGTTYAHNIAVCYDGVNEKKWTIFNQDRAAVPAGKTFEVTVPPASKRFVHYTEPVNTAKDRTYLDNPLTNGEPEAVLAVTQNRSPGGGRGASNDHPIDVIYDTDARKWAIYNDDDAPMPDGAAFNIAVSGVKNP